MPLSYIHPDEDSLQSDVEWTQAELMRRKRLFSSQKTDFGALRKSWEDTQGNYAGSFLERLASMYTAQYPSGDQQWGEFSLQVQVQGKGIHKKGSLIFHSKVGGQKCEVSLEISVSEARALLFTKESGKTEKIPYVKTLKTTVNIGGTTMNVIRYLGRHSGVYLRIYDLKSLQGM